MTHTPNLDGLCGQMRKLLACDEEFSEQDLARFVRIGESVANQPVAETTRAPRKADANPSS